MFWRILGHITLYGFFIGAVTSIIGFISHLTKNTDGSPTPPPSLGTHVEATHPVLESHAHDEWVRIKSIVSFEGIVTVSGAVLLIWVGWLTWYDITVWGKEVPLILFGSRTGEAMSLGIGARAIHYILAGFALVVPGLITLKRSTRPPAQGASPPDTHPEKAEVIEEPATEDQDEERDALNQFLNEMADAHVRARGDERAA